MLSMNKTNKGNKQWTHDMKNKFEEGFYVYHLQKTTCDSLFKYELWCESTARAENYLMKFRDRFCVSVHALQFRKLDKYFNSYGFSVVKRKEKTEWILLGKQDW